MAERDLSFAVDEAGLVAAMQALFGQPNVDPAAALALFQSALPPTGLGEAAVLKNLAPVILGGAQPLDAPHAFAHMDPPTPWITWAMAAWNARLNQNLLHPATAPVARDVEARVVSWLAPYFGMDGGHMVPGSTIANLTAIWAARELRGVAEVAAPDTAHVSVEKAARLLGLGFRKLPTDHVGRLLPDIDGDLAKTCLVLVVGSTSTGVVDPLHLAGRAAWTHVDAAWAGPLRLSPTHKARLDGIEVADSVAVSAHKWLFQPKESALVFFRNTATAHDALSFGGAYLAAPNIGVLGSHGAAAVPLLATLLAWGADGIAERIDRCMVAADDFAAFVDDHPSLEVLAPPETGVIVWRARTKSTDQMLAELPNGLASRTMIAGEPWLRCVAANPVVDIEAVKAAIRRVL